MTREWIVLRVYVLTVGQILADFTPMSSALTVRVKISPISHQHSMSANALIFANDCLFKNSMNHLTFSHFLQFFHPSCDGPSPSLFARNLVYLVEILDCLNSFTGKHPLKR